jgi:hypothetical protein
MSRLAAIGHDPSFSLLDTRRLKVVERTFRFQLLNLSPPSKGSS